MVDEEGCALAGSSLKKKQTNIDFCDGFAQLLILLLI
jgi:hypothetical protein